MIQIFSKLKNSEPELFYFISLCISVLSCIYKNKKNIILIDRYTVNKLKIILILLT